MVAGQCSRIVIFHRAMKAHPAETSRQLVECSIASYCARYVYTAVRWSHPGDRRFNRDFFAILQLRLVESEDQLRCALSIGGDYLIDMSDELRTMRQLYALGCLHGAREVRGYYVALFGRFGSYRAIKLSIALNQLCSLRLILSDRISGNDKDSSDKSK